MLVPRAEIGYAPGMLVLGIEHTMKRGGDAASFAPQN
jgi:hypothetical protein